MLTLDNLVPWQKEVLEKSALFGDIGQQLHSQKKHTVSRPVRTLKVQKSFLDEATGVVTVLTPNWSDADEAALLRQLEQCNQEEKRLRDLDHSLWLVLYESISPTLRTSIDNKIASDPTSLARSGVYDSLALYKLVSEYVGAAAQSSVQDLLNEWSTRSMLQSETFQTFLFSFNDKIKRIENAGHVIPDKDKIKNLVKLVIRADFANNTTFSTVISTDPNTAEYPSDYPAIVGKLTYFYDLWLMLLQIFYVVLWRSLDN